MMKKISLPEIGDTIYSVEDDFKTQQYRVVKEKIRLIEIEKDGIIISDSNYSEYLLEDFNKVWFLNLDKAEKEMKKLNRSLQKGAEL